MKFDKRIITHQLGGDNYTFSNGFIISDGTYSRTPIFLNQLVEEAKQDFPNLKDDDIEFFIITQSDYNKGFAGVRFSLLENTKKEGYREGNRLDFYYC